MDLVRQNSRQERPLPVAQERSYKSHQKVSKSQNKKEQRKVTIVVKDRQLQAQCNQLRRLSRLRVKISYNTLIYIFIVTLVVDASRASS